MNKKRVKKEKLSFGIVLNKTFEDYKRNFKSILKFILVFIGIPLLLFSLIEFLLMLNDPSLFNALSKPGNNLELPLYFTIITYLFSFVILFFTAFVSVGIINSSLKKDKYSFKEIYKNGRTRYWKFILFCIVSGIFLFLLYLALIIPGIIFSIYWAVSTYIFFDKNEGILNSLKQSRKMIKGKWWKTFGYSLLLILILFVFSIAIGIIKAPIFLISIIHLAKNTEFSLGFLGISSLIDVLYKTGTSLINTPLAILFFKNFYQFIKKK